MDFYNEIVATNKVPNLYYYGLTVDKEGISSIFLVFIKEFSK